VQPVLRVLLDLVDRVALRVLLEPPVLKAYKDLEVSQEQPVLKVPMVFRACKVAKEVRDLRAHKDSKDLRDLLEQEELPETLAPRGERVREDFLDFLEERD
jgi:hypothetical protein